MEEQKNKSPQSSGVSASASANQRRISAKRKQQIVTRLLQGESIEILSRENNVTAAAISQWRDRFLQAGLASLKADQRDSRDEEVRQLHAKVGQLTMENELLNQKIDRMESGHPLAYRRSKR